MSIVREEGVLLVTVVGEVRLNDLIALRAQVRQAWMEQPTRAAIYDYRLASFDVRPRDWDGLYNAAARWRLTECVSNAIVTSPADFNAFLARGSRYAALGVCYTTFTDYDRALCWAKEHPMPARPKRVARR